MQETSRRLYSINETADQLSIGRAKLYTLIAGGELDVVKIGRRSLVTAESLDAYVKRLTGQA